MICAPSPHSSKESLSVKVVESVAAYEGVEMTALPPLATAINPDALDELFDPIENPGGTDTHLTLEYNGHRVRIHADHSVTID